MTLQSGMLIIIVVGTVARIRCQNMLALFLEKNRSSQASFVLLICILIFCVHRMQQSLAAAERAFLISLTHLVMNRDCLWRTRMYYQLAAYTRHHPGI